MIIHTACPHRESIALVGSAVLQSLPLEPSHQVSANLDHDLGRKPKGGRIPIAPPGVGRCWSLWAEVAITAITREQPGDVINAACSAIPSFNTRGHARQS
jgi:hypothetical protein